MNAGYTKVGYDGTGGLTVTGSGSALSLVGDFYVGFDGIGTLDVSSMATVTCNGLDIADSGGPLPTIASATVNVSDASIIDKSFLTIGTFGKANVTLSSGATVLATSLSLGSQSSGNATLSASGTATRLLLSGSAGIGELGHAELDILSGAQLTSSLTGTTPSGPYGLTIGSGAGFANTVTVSGGTISLADGLSVGIIGNGVLVVSNGGTVAVDTSNAYNAPLDIAANTNQSSGLVEVTGAGSTVKTNGALTVGGTGNGTLLASNGATVSAGSLFLGYQYAGNGPETGTVTLAGASTLTAGVAVVSGDTLSVGTGSTLAVSNGLTIVNFFQRGGIIFDTGLGSAILAKGGIDVHGAGSLLGIAAGAHAIASATTGQTALDVDTGGLLLLNGAGSLLTIQGGPTQIGGALVPNHAGGGTLTIQNGAELISNAAPGNMIAAIVGNNASNEAASTASISGRDVSTNAAAEWLVSGDLLIGNFTGADASLSCSYGATVSVAGTLSLSSTATSGLTADTGALITATNLTTFGNTNTFIRNGAIISVGSALVGNVTLGGGTLKATGTIEAGWNNNIGGSGTIQSAKIVVDNGSMIVASGNLHVVGAVTGSGSFLVGNNSTLTLVGAGADTVGLHFLGAGTIETGAPAKLAGEITGWSAGDVIDITQLAFTTESFANGVLSLYAGHQAFAPLHFSGALTASNFTLKSDGHGGTIVGFHT